MSQGTLRVAVAVLGCLIAVLAPAASGTAAPSKGAHTSIVGGGKADPAKWPYLAALRINGQAHCGGSVIAPTKILTAAHCLQLVMPSELTVITGRPNLADTSVGQVLGVASLAIHPDYETTGRHDLGVITLAQPTTAPAVALPTLEEAAAATADGAPVRVAGWGDRDPRGTRPSTVLKEVAQWIATNRRCQRAIGKGDFGYTAKSMICVKGQKFRKFKAFGKGSKKIRVNTTACRGDSGGPLVSDTPAGPRVVGTVSFGPPICGGNRLPAVFARVADGLDFINTAMASP